MLSKLEIKVVMGDAKDAFPLKEIFLVESPKKVLKKLSKNNLIYSYKDLTFNSAMTGTYKNERIAYGLKISGVDNETQKILIGKVDLSIDDISFKHIKNKTIPNYSKINQEEFLGELIVKYLVKTDCYSNFLTKYKRIVEKNTNYLELKKRSKEYNQKINQIKDVASVFFNNNLSINDLREIPITLPEIGSIY